MNKIEELINQLCPDGVEFRDLGEVMSITRGASPRPILNFITNEPDGIPWIKIGDVDAKSKFITSSKEKITKEGATKSRYLKKGDFILSNSMSFGRPYILAINGCIHDGWISMQNFNNSLIPDFLYHLLRSDDIQNYWKQKASSGTVQNLNADIVRGTKIPCPPIEIQQEIAGILDKFMQLEAELEAELEARRKQYEYYRNQLLMPLMVNDTWLMNGKEVEWKTLGDCIEKNLGGGTPSKANANFWNGDIPWASVGDLSFEGNFISTTRNFITIEGLKNSSSNLISKGNVIVAVKISPGKMKIADIDIAINQDLRGLSLKKFLNSKFLLYYFQTLSIAGNGTIVQGITVDTLNRVKVPLPPLAEQERIVSILDKFDKLVNDISEGLPAEIQARRRQYEYYRGKLLDFKSIEETRRATSQRVYTIN
jgi:type I restriction enzyme, S subunit